MSRRHGQNDQVEGITVDQIKQLMLCFAKRQPKSYFNRYQSMRARSFLQQPNAQQHLEAGSGGGGGAASSSSPTPGALTREASLSPEWSRKSAQNVGVGDFGDAAQSDSGGSSDDDVLDERTEDLLDNTASMFNVKLRPLNRAVFIERVRRVLPDRPDSVINSWFQQLDTDRNETVSWSAFSAFLLFRSATIEAAAEKSAEFHTTPESPETAPPAVIRHNQPITCMLINPRSSQLLTGGPDGVISAWDPATLAPHGAVMTLRTYILDMAHLDDAHKIAVSCMDRTVTILDARTMRVIRCFGGRPIPRYMESKEISKTIEFFEKRPDWVRIERGPRVLTAPPEVPSLNALLEKVKMATGGDRGGGGDHQNQQQDAAAGGGAAADGGGAATAGGDGSNSRRQSPSNNRSHSSSGKKPHRPPLIRQTHSSRLRRDTSPQKQQQQQRAQTSHGSGTTTRRASPYKGSNAMTSTARHLDRPWAQPPPGSMALGERGGGGGGGGGVGGTKSSRSDMRELEDATAIGTYLVGEAALARTDVSRKTEIHVLLELEKSPTCMCAYTASQVEEVKGQVRGLEGATIESGSAFSTDPILFGMPDGSIMQYNLPTMFPRATLPKVTWRPHRDRVQMIKYTREFKGVLSCSDDGTFVMSNPVRGDCIVRNYRIPMPHSQSSTLLQMQQAMGADYQKHASFSASAAAGGGAASGGGGGGGGAGFGGSHDFSGGPVASGGPLSATEMIRLKLGFAAQQHKPPAICFDYCTDLKMVGCCAYDRHAYLYDVAQDAHVARLSGFTAPCVSLAFNGADYQVICCAADRTVRIYDTRYSETPLQTLEKPPFHQFSGITNRSLLLQDKRLYFASTFPVGYVSRSAAGLAADSHQHNQHQHQQGSHALPGGGGGSQSARHNAARRGSTAIIAQRLGGGSSNSSAPQRQHTMLIRGRRSRGSQPFHGACVHAAFVDDIGASSGVPRLFTLCPLQMMCWTLNSGDPTFSLSLPSTSSGRPDNQATCACINESCLKVVVGYDDGSVVLWVPSTGEAAARLPEHESVPGKVVCVAICYRHSFSASAKQMLILASIQDKVLFLKQGGPYMLTVASAWTCPQELGHVTALHELGISNSVLAGTHSGALVILSLTMAEQEGSALVPVAKFVPPADSPLGSSSMNRSGSRELSSDDEEHNNLNSNNKQQRQQQHELDENGNDQQQQQGSALSAATENEEGENEFGRVESLVHMQSMGKNIYGAVHLNGDIVFWDAVHRIQVGALCIRGLQTAIVHTVLRDHGAYQFLAYSDDLGNLYVRRLDYLVTGSDFSDPTSFSRASDGTSLSSFAFGSTNDALQPQKQLLDPYLMTNVSASPSPALVVASTRVGVTPAAHIVAVYRAPWSGFNEASHQQPQHGGGGGAGAARRGTVAPGAPPGISVEPPSDAHQSTGRRKSVLLDLQEEFGDGEKSMIFDDEDGGGGSSVFCGDGGGPLDALPEYICVVCSNISTPDVRCYAFELTEGTVTHVGSGGGKEWLTAPSKCDFASCIDTEDWKLTLEASSVGIKKAGLPATLLEKTETKHMTVPPAVVFGAGSSGGASGGDNFADMSYSNISLPAVAGASSSSSHQPMPPIRISSPLSGSSDDDLLVGAGDATREEERRQQGRSNSMEMPKLLVEAHDGMLNNNSNIDNNNNNEAGRRGVSSAALGGGGARTPKRSQSPAMLGGADAASDHPPSEGGTVIELAIPSVWATPGGGPDSAAPSRSGTPMVNEDGGGEHSSRRRKRRNRAVGFVSGAGGVAGDHSHNNNNNNNNQEEDDEDAEDEEDAERKMLLEKKERQKREMEDQLARSRNSKKQQQHQQAGDALIPSPPPPVSARTSAATLSASRPQGRPLSLIVPRGHNDRMKRAQRLTNMCKAEALEDMRRSRVQATQASDSGSSSPQARGWHVVSRTMHAAKALMGMTPRQAGLVGNFRGGAAASSSGRGSNVLSMSTTARTSSSLSASGQMMQVMSPLASSMSHNGAPMTPHFGTLDGATPYTLSFTDQLQLSRMSSPMNPNLAGGAGGGGVAFPPASPLAFSIDTPAAHQQQHLSSTGGFSASARAGGSRGMFVRPTKLTLSARATPNAGASLLPLGGAPATVDLVSPLASPSRETSQQRRSSLMSQDGGQHQQHGGGGGGGGQLKSVGFDEYMTDSLMATTTVAPQQQQQQQAEGGGNSPPALARVGTLAFTGGGEPPHPPPPLDSLTSHHSNEQQQQQQQQQDEEHEEDEDDAPKKRRQDGDSFAHNFAEAASLEELAHRKLDQLRSKFKIYSSDIQQQVERNVRKNTADSSSSPGGGAASGGGGGGDVMKKMIAGDGNSNLLLESAAVSKHRLQAEPLDNYGAPPDADVLLDTLRVTKPLEMNRAMGIGGKTSIFGVLTPSPEMQDSWKQRQADEEARRMQEQAEAAIIVPDRNDAEMAFLQPKMTQNRGRKIPKVASAADGEAGSPAESPLADAGGGSGSPGGAGGGSPVGSQ